MKMLWGLISALLLSTSVTASSPSDCACYTETRTVQPTTACPRSRCGPRPLCILLKESIIPGPNPKCPSTPTVTVTGGCPTCQRGCGTSYKTRTADEPCLGPFSPITPTPYHPTPTASSASCFTYTSIPEPPYCPGFPVATCVRPACARLTSITVPAANSACPETRTIVATPSCINECKTGCETFTSLVTASAAGAVRTPEMTIM